MATIERIKDSLMAASICHQSRGNDLVGEWQDLVDKEGHSVETEELRREYDRMYHNAYVLKEAWRQLGDLKTQEEWAAEWGTFRVDEIEKER